MITRHRGVRAAWVVPGVALALLLVGNACTTNSISGSAPIVVTQDVGPTGATILVDDGLVVIIPPKALAADTSIQAGDASGYPMLPMGMTPPGDIFMVTPVTTQLLQNATVYLPIPSAGATGLSPWYAATSTGSWAQVAPPSGVVNLAATYNGMPMISVVTPHFGYFTLLPGAPSGAATACEIGGASVPSGATDPSNACQTCQPMSWLAGWTVSPTGSSCGSGEICSDGVCAAGCFIGATAYPAGMMNTANACQSCQPAASTTAWTDAPAGTTCGANQVCSSGSCVSGCTISGTAYSLGAPNPSDGCQTCQPGTSTSQWSPAPNGMACGAGQVCNAGSCAGGCVIAGMYYASAAPNPMSACQSCQPAVSTAAWSNLADGTACGNAQICGSGMCGSECEIGGALQASGAKKPGDPCQSCQPGTSTTAWTGLADGTSCGAGTICSAGLCAADCYIGGAVVAPGTNPANACQVCQPATSTTAWTNAATGTTCGTGKICSAGICSTGCDINGTVYTPGTVNPTDSCQSCQSGSTTAWTSAANGTSCGTGKICDNGSCLADCYIAATIYPSATANPANACQSCQPATSTATWSNVAAGTSCGTGKICSAGVCAAECDIGGVIYTSGAVNPANACDSCKPATSTSAWNVLNCTTAPTGHVCMTSGTVCGCNAASDCPPNQACNATSHQCVTTCSATQACNGGCCSGGTCATGTLPASCGGTGGTCSVCSGSTPHCTAGACTS